MYTLPPAGRMHTYKRENDEDLWFYSSDYAERAPTEGTSKVS